MLKKQGGRKQEKIKILDRQDIHVYHVRDVNLDSQGEKAFLVCKQLARSGD